MKTLKITAENRERYENTELYFDGSIEIGANLGWVKFTRIEARLSIIALSGSGIEAGWGIEAGEGIKAGSGIEAGEGIKAKYLSIKLRIFAGLCQWRIPTPAEMEIRAEIRSGTVCFGNVVEPKKLDVSEDEIEKVMEDKTK